MKFKNIDSLSITECCELLNLRREDLPEAIQELNAPTEKSQLLIDRLNSLLSEDKSAIESCRTIEQYENYLSTWVDGLYHGYAQSRIARLKAEADELAFYKNNKDSISGCEAYLQQYPKGRFVNEVQSLLAQKKKSKRKRNVIIFILLTLLLIAACIFAYSNYVPVSYVNVDENVKLNNLGSEVSLSILTDAIGSTISATSSDDRIYCWVSGKTLYVSGENNPNEEIYATITITAHSSFLGSKLSDRKQATIAVSQETGYATYLDVSNDDIYFSANGGKESVTIDTDGIFAVSTAPKWVTTSINGKTLNLECGENSGNAQNGYIIIKSGDLEERINIRQSEDNTPNAEVNKVWVEHYVSRTGYNNIFDPYFGWLQVPYTYNVMRIHVDFDVDNMKGKTVRVCAFFYDEDGEDLTTSNNQFRTSDGQVTIQNTSTVTYKNSNWSDFIMEIPYSVMKRGSNKFFIQIQDSNGNLLANSDYEYFTVF